MKADRKPEPYWTQDPPSAAPRWLRALLTPWSDLRRGRVVERITRVCMPRRLREAELPDAVVKYIAQVTQKTCLRWYERRRATDELLAAFHHHVARPDRPWPYPLDDRRQRKRLAKALRAEHVARRHPADRWAFRCAGYACLAFLLAVLLFPVYIAIGKPEPKVDYLPVVNADAAAVPEADRAWPLYRDALLALRDAPTFDHEQAEKDFFSYGGHPRDPLWAEMRSFLAEFAEPLALVDTAALRPGMGFTLRPVSAMTDDEVLAVFEDREGAQSLFNESDLLYDLPLAHLGGLRQLARLKYPEALAAAEDGDAERFIAIVGTFHAMADHAAEVPLLFCGLTGLSFETLAVELAMETLRDRPELLDSIRLKALSTLFEGRNPRSLRRTYGDFALTRDWVQRSFTDNGRGGGRMTRRGMKYQVRYGHLADETTHWLLRELLHTGFACVWYWTSPSRADVARTIDELQRLEKRDHDLPAWRADERESAGFFEAYVDAHAVGGLMVFYLPSTQHSLRAFDLGEAQRRAVLAVLALHRHRHDRGGWPETLDALVPDYLEELPRDPADGQPLRYALGGGGPVLYSLGADGDDDGGTIPAPVDNAWWAGDDVTRNAQAQRFGDDDPVDGDWVLFPPPAVDPVEIPDPNADPWGMGMGMGGFGMGGMGMGATEDEPAADAAEGGMAEPGE